jgi:hypothetical protein
VKKRKQSKPAIKTPLKAQNLSGAKFEDVLRKMLGTQPPHTPKNKQP